MQIKLTSECQSADGGNAHPVVCSAKFTVEGQRGNQKFLTGGIFTLLAEDADAASYLWQVVSSPPDCDYLITGVSQHLAKLSLPGSGAYTVQLTVQKEECTAQERVILWVATPCQLFRLPATNEALRFDGDPEWAGDLSKILQQVDCQLPTPEQKAAMDNAHEAGPDNPFATLNDLPKESDPDPDTPGDSLSENEVAAIKQGEEPKAENPFITRSALLKAAPTPEQKAAMDTAVNPHAENPFVTNSYFRQLAPTQEQKKH